MKQFLITFAAILMLLTGTHAQSVYFNFTNGTQAGYNLEDIDKITFTNDVMNVFLLNATTLSWNVSTIAHYTYSESSVDVEELIANTRKLAVNIYPNPNSGDVNIQYNLASDSPVRIEWLSIDGKLLHTIFQGDQEKGENSLGWNASNYADGTYFCRITSSNLVVTKTIIMAGE
ncbi:MAG TPA: T9SS type A sorting domain-containing protein [Flavobacteriales bacterium]|nr:T9SS type A sorting domain-containing protein [Flavobacteriales bacterium]